MPARTNSHVIRDPLLYCDQQLFDEERERVFKRSWALACHVSEVPRPGDARVVVHAIGVAVALRRYDDSVRASEVGGAKRRVRTEVDCAGFVWMHLDEYAPSLRWYFAGALDRIAPTLSAEPFDVFAFERTTVNANWKTASRDAERRERSVCDSSRFEHDPSILHPAYFHSQHREYPNGHVSAADRCVRYDGFSGRASRTLALPGRLPDQWTAAAIFPRVEYRICGSSLRVDAVTPAAPGRAVVETWGLAPSSDTRKERAQRVREFDAIWGPAGCAREGTPHLEGFGERAFYAEWERRLGRSASDPFREALAG